MSVQVAMARGTGAAVPQPTGIVRGIERPNQAARARRAADRGRRAGAPPLVSIARLLAVLAGIAIYSSPRASAQQSVETLVREGVELRRQGRDVEARDVFERAHALSPSARTRAQVALADQALGNWVVAELGLEEALAASADPWVTRNEASLRAALEHARDALGTLRVELAEHSEGDVRLDGRQLTQQALRSGVRTPAGTHQLELRAGDRQLDEQRVVVPARGELVVKLGEPRAEQRKLAEQRVGIPARSELGAPHAAPVPSAAAPRTGGPLLEPHAAARAAEASAAAPASAGAAPDSERSDGVPRWLGWTAAAMAGGLLTTGVVAHVARERSASRYNDDARCHFGELTRDQRCGDDRRRGETAAAVAVGAYALGALALGGALTLLLWPDPEPQEPRHVACIDVQLGAGAGYVATRLSF